MDLLTVVYLRVVGQLSGYVLHKYTCYRLCLVGVKLMTSVLKFTSGIRVGQYRKATWLE